MFAIIQPPDQQPQAWQWWRDWPWTLNEYTYLNLMYDSCLRKLSRLLALMYNTSLSNKILMFVQMFIVLYIIMLYVCVCSFKAESINTIHTFMCIIIFNLVVYCVVLPRARHACQRLRWRHRSRCFAVPRYIRTPWLLRKYAISNKTSEWSFDFSVMCNWFYSLSEVR